jgi:hypothetical protein
MIFDLKCICLESTFHHHMNCHDRLHPFYLHTCEHKLIST